MHKVFKKNPLTFIKRFLLKFQKEVLKYLLKVLKRFLMLLLINAKHRLQITF